MDLANYDSHYIPVNGLSLGGSPGSYWLLSCLSSVIPTIQLKFNRLITMYLDSQQNKILSLCGSSQIPQTKSQ
jgi:hypothetical protein